MEIYVDRAHCACELADLPIEELTRFVLQAEEVPALAEVSVSFVTDDEIAQLNERYRGKQGPTDVLSFECDGLDDDPFDDPFFALEAGEEGRAGDEDALSSGDETTAAAAETELAAAAAAELTATTSATAVASPASPATATAQVPFELGDVIVAPDVARRQTQLYGTTFEGEITLLVLHGLLHLCGYDHVEDDEAELMEARERELLGRWADAGHEQVRHVRDDTIRARGVH